MENTVIMHDVSQAPPKVVGSFTTLTKAVLHRADRLRNGGHDDTATGIGVWDKEAGRIRGLAVYELKALILADPNFFRGREYSSDASTFMVTKEEFDNMMKSVPHYEIRYI